MIDDDDMRSRSDQQLEEKGKRKQEEWSDVEKRRELVVCEAP